MTPKRASPFRRQWPCPTSEVPHPWEEYASWPAQPQSLWPYRTCPSGPEEARRWVGAEVAWTAHLAQQGARCHEWPGRAPLLWRAGAVEAGGLGCRARRREPLDLALASGARTPPPLLLPRPVGEEAAGLQALSLGALRLRRRLQIAPIACAPLG